MDLHGRQTSQGVHNILFRVFTDLLNRGSLHHFCQHRPGSDRGGTSEGFEARSRDVTISNLQVQMQNIPTGGVLRYADGIRILKSTDISRILIVIQDRIVVQTQGVISGMDDRRASWRGSVANPLEYTFAPAWCQPHKNSSKEHYKQAVSTGKRSA